MFLIAALLFAPPKASELFDACTANFGRMGAYTVRIQAKAAKPGLSTRVRFDLAVQGQDALLRIREPSTGIMDHSDRTFMLHGKKLVAYDAVADERLQRTVSEGGSVGERLAAQLGQVDQSLNLVLGPSEMRQFFSGFRAFQDWRISHNGDTVTIERFHKGTSAMFRFVGAHPMISEVALTAKGSTLDWAYTFQPGATIGLKIPSAARRVSSFTEREAPPRYKSPQARLVVERMMRAYGALRNGTIDIRSDEGNSHLILSGRCLKEIRPRCEWAYDGSVLSIHNRSTGQFYQGKAVRVILAEYVTKVGGEVDPIIRRIVSHRAPYQDLFPANGVVRLIGPVGDKADIIEVTTPNLKLSLFVRRDNHLLDSMESETIDRPGRVQTRNQRWFRYSHMGEAGDIADFRVTAGATKVHPLPELKVLGETR
jgi:hypothetical protein